MAIVYLPEEQQDAEITRRTIEAEGRHCLMLAGDLSDPDFCREVLDRVIAEHGELEVLVSNAAYEAFFSSDADSSQDPR